MTATPPYGQSEPIQQVADEKLDYMADWSQWLDCDDSIIESTWTTSDPGLVVDSSSFTATSATVWLSGGPAFPPDAPVGAKIRCYAVNHITTDGGRQNSFVLVLDVKQS